MTQRDKMRELFMLHDGNKEAIIEAYAAAELAGDVSRQRNANGYGTIQYATALWNDGVKKGWLPSVSTDSGSQRTNQAAKRNTREHIVEKSPNHDTPNNVNSWQEELLQAAKSGDIRRIRIVLNQKIDPNTTDPGGNTALILAASSGNTECVMALLSAKADPTRKNDKGNSAVDVAVRRGFVDVVRVLSRATAELSHDSGQSRLQNNTNCLDDVLEELNSLVGLNLVKAHVSQKVNLLRIQKLKEAQGIPVAPQTLHLVFSGNPGTGKTTVARLIAKIYQCLGILSKGHLVEVHANDLIASYVGQTGPKTMEVINRAMGGVLFIDEAYVLTNSAHSYGQEAVDTLLPMLSNLKDDLMVIVAGYPTEMEQFISSNPGLRRRFPEVIEFEDYTPDDLTRVFLKSVQDQHHVLAHGTEEKVHTVFEKRYRHRTREFGNAGEATILFEKALANQSNRLAHATVLDGETLSTICSEDIPIE